MISIAHLLNTPSGDDFARHFPIHSEPNYPVDEDGDSAFVDPESPSEASHWGEEAEPYDPYVGATDSAFDGFFESLETLSFGQTAFRPDNLSSSISVVPAPTDAMSQALEPRALEVRQILSTTAGNVGNTLPEAQHMLELGPAIEQINGAEIDSLVSLYFEHYHRHCPITHRPSFHATLCPLPLLLSVMALGGMYAPEASRRHRMLALLDVIEAYIYSLPGLRDEYATSLDLSKAPDEEALQYQFEHFQGAYLIIIAQYFSGNPAAKRRARRQRYTRVLDVISLLSLTPRNTLTRFTDRSLLQAPHSPAPTLPLHPRLHSIHILGPHRNPHPPIQHHVRLRHRHGHFQQRPSPHLLLRTRRPTPLRLSLLRTLLTRRNAQSRNLPQAKNETRGCVSETLLASERVAGAY